MLISSVRKLSKVAVIAPDSKNFKLGIMDWEFWGANASSEREERVIHERGGGATSSGPC